jgi:ABC-2 type transport system permease protein
MSAADLTASAQPSARPKARGASVRLLRSELRLVIGRRRNQAGMLVLASVPILLAVALKFAEPREGRGPDFISSATSNGIFIALAALSIELALFLPLAVAALSGDTIAGEANIGTLRYLLTVPVGRTRLLLVKYVSLVIGGALGIVVVAVTGLAIGGMLFGLGPTTLLSGTEVGLADAMGRLGIAVIYLSIALAGLAAIGLFVSTLTEQPIGAMIAVTVISTVMWILDGIPQLAWLQPWLLVHYWPAFSDAFRDPIFFEQMQQGVLVALAYVVLFLSLAWARFTQKDITS